MSWIRRETEKGTVQYICPRCHDYHEFREDFGERTFSENYIFCRRCGERNGTGNAPTLTPPNEPLTCGLVDRHGMPLRAGDTVAADKFFVYAVRYGSHNVNPDNCAPAYQVGWYLEIMWAYPGFEDSVGHTEPLYDIDGTAARYPAHCADTADGLYNLKLEVCCRPPEGDADA